METKNFLYVAAASKLERDTSQVLKGVISAEGLIDALKSLIEGSGDKGELYSAVVCDSSILQGPNKARYISARAARVLHADMARQVAGQISEGLLVYFNPEYFADKPRIEMQTRSPFVGDDYVWVPVEELTPKGWIPLEERVIV